MKALVCPQCGARIEVDESREYGFCSYCGTKIQLHEKIIVQHTGSITLESENSEKKLIENGKTFTQLQDYRNLQIIASKLLHLYPRSPWGYYFECIRQTENFSVFIPGTPDFLSAKILTIQSVCSSEESGEICSKLKYQMERFTLCERVKALRADVAKGPRIAPCIVFSILATLMWIFVLNHNLQTPDYPVFAAVIVAFLFSLPFLVPAIISIIRACLRHTALIRLRSELAEAEELLSNVYFTSI